MMRKVYLLIAIAVITKVILLFVMNRQLQMNDDEYVNYLTALNHHNGNGYTLYHAGAKTYYATAFHASFSIFVYELMIEHHISPGIWVLFIDACCVVFYAISIYCFFKIALSFLTNEKFAFYATIIYAFYPSIMFYLGTQFLFENVALPLLVIVVYRLMKSYRQTFSRSDYFLIPAAVAFSCLLRPQMIVVYAFVFTIYFSGILRKKQYKSIPLLLLTFAIVCAVHIPALIKNKAQFGKYMLSTQSGYELFQGHNPIAKGSWNGNWRKPGNDFYVYAHQQINNIDSLNELQESEARRKAAISWIMKNPGSELKLCLKKAAIYFLPVNSDSSMIGASMINPVNLLVHLFFIGYILMMIYKRTASSDELLLLSPFVASLGLTLVFFAGYRWRYYAEPFMILLAWKCITVLYNRFYGTPTTVNTQLKTTP